MQSQTIIFIGPQGSGKGTQVEKLINWLKINRPEEVVVDIQTGRLFRALAAEESFASKTVAEWLERGQLLPDFLNNALWGTEMSERLVPDSHLLIDGFPRNLKQAAVLTEALNFFDRQNVQVVNLATAEDVVKARMMERGRVDDNAEAIVYRLNQYKEETEPVLEAYRADDAVRVHDIDGGLDIEAVHEQILVALNLTTT